MLKTNWHTHTKRCGHAVGEDEDYVLSAIEGGLTTLGFSDHAAYQEPYPSERMNLSQVEEYKQSILNLKETYKNQIQLYLGMEVECYQSEWETLKKYRNELDYCILGQHNLTIDSESSYDLTNGDELKRYADQIEYACEHSLCDYVAHPDVCLWNYPRIDESVKAIAERIAQISVTYNMPMELNCGSGVRLGLKEYEDGARYPYPSRVFFEAFAKYHAPVIIGLDIHDPKYFKTDEWINRALSVTEGLEMNWLIDYDLVSAAKERKKKFY